MVLRRSPSRAVLCPLIRFQCHSTEYLRQTGLQSIDWGSIFTPRTRFLRCSPRLPTGHPPLAVCPRSPWKDAVVRSVFACAKGERPKVEPTTPDLWINLYPSANRANHRARPLRADSMHPAWIPGRIDRTPCRETVAAAWSHDRVGMAEREALGRSMCGFGHHPVR
jgi:hypothetical protein